MTRGKPVPGTRKRRWATKRGNPTDARRVRRVDPNGPQPEEQAKLLGSKAPRGRFDYGIVPRSRLREKELEAEAADPDMTPLPRLTGRVVRIYLPGKTILGRK